MKCIVCSSSMNFFFDKQFDSFGLSRVVYMKCSNCGFVFSKTHAEMDSQAWIDLNYSFHTYIENKENVRGFNQPPYLAQSALINVLEKRGILSGEYLDWGGGYGTLSKILLKYFDIRVSVYDKYIREDERSTAVQYRSSDEIKSVHYNTVISSAVFEHVTRREHLEEINACVSKSGCLAVHTVICEYIPQDPNWFYLLPVHTAFHTNKSMELLMQQWGYICSLYCPTAKTWILMKGQVAGIERLIKEINAEFQFEYLFYKKGFMDYWK